MYVKREINDLNKIEIVVRIEVKSDKRKVYFPTLYQINAMNAFGRMCLAESPNQRYESWQMPKAHSSLGICRMVFCMILHDSAGVNLRDKSIVVVFSVP